MSLEQWALSELTKWALSNEPWALSELTKWALSNEPRAVSLEGITKWAMSLEQWALNEESSRKVWFATVKLVFLIVRKKARYNRLST